MWGSKPATYYSQGTHNSVSQGSWMLSKETKNSNMKLLNGASDWKVSVDLKTSQQFPVHIIQTEKWPDIVVWSNSKKSILFIELTVPWEENRKEAHKQKKNWYETLRADCMEKRWICHVIHIEVSSRGFLGHSVISFLSKIGITGCSLKVASYCLQTMVQLGFSQEWNVFSMNEIHVELPFPCDYITWRNGYCKCIMTSMAKSKRVLKIINCTKNEDERKM